jgi:succinate dehydrogenase/fumarate reductase flavoprotein subunit
VIQDAAWTAAGIVRNEAGLKQGLGLLDAIEFSWKPEGAPSVAALETANLMVSARVILQGALARIESRGAHYRTDFPQRNDAELAAHSWVQSQGKTTIGSRPSSADTK